jgi:O-antigen ligase
MNRIVYQVIDKGIFLFALLTLFLYPYGLVARYPLECMIILLIVSLFFKEFRRSKHDKNENVYFGFQITFWILIAFSYFWSHHKEVSLLDLEIKMSLLIIPLVFYYGGIPLMRRKNLVLLSFFVFMLCYSIINIYYVLCCLYYSANTIHWFLGNYENYTYLCLPNLQHHTYLSLYLTFAIFIGLDLIFRTKNYINGVFLKVIIIIGTLILSFFVFLINSRAGILALLITLPIYILLKIPGRFKILAISACSIFVLTSSCYFLSSNPRVKQITTAVKEDPKQISNPEKSDPRIGIWTASWDCVKEHIWFGVGNGDSRAAMIKKYIQKAQNDKYYNLLNNGKLYNSHNQYLETWLTTGILGFLLLLGTLLIPFFRDRKTRHYELLAAFIIITALSFIFESMYDSFIGVGFIPFFISFLFYGNEKTDVKIS